MSELTFDGAVGWFLVGLINDHFPHPADEEEDPELGTAGCIVNCGPCGALHWTSETPHRRTWFEDFVRETGYHISGWAYWDESTDGLVWDWFESYWSRHKSCGVSNGIPTGCHFGELDAEGTLDCSDTEWIATCSLDGELGRYPMTAEGHNEAVQAWMSHTATVHDSPDLDARSMLIRISDAAGGQ